MKQLTDKPLAYREEMVESLVRMYKVLRLASDNVTDAQKRYQKNPNTYTLKQLNDASQILANQNYIVDTYELGATAEEKIIAKERS